MKTVNAIQMWMLVTVCLWYHTRADHVHHGNVLKLEAENYSGKDNFIYRQSASQDKTVSLTDNDVLSIPFCLRRRTYVTINDVFYTNDGLPNTARISVDGHVVGDWTSHNRTDGGNLWNNMHTSGHVGRPMMLRSGPHRLELRVLPSIGVVDKYGIEIDAIYLDIEDPDINQHYLQCLNTMCSDTITYSDRHRDRDDIPSGKIIQMSRPTQCLEEDNIKVPIYHENIQQFRISALPPRYRTFWTYKDAQFDGCPEYSEYHWDYMTVVCSNQTITRYHRGSTLSSNLATGINNTTVCRISVKFDLQGVLLGKTDAHIGAMLQVGLGQPSDHTVDITPVYGVTKNRSMMYEKLPQKAFSLVKPSDTWNFPDFTWAEISFGSGRFLNEIIVDIPMHHNLQYIRLKRRAEKPQETTTIFDNMHLIIQKVEFDFWWRDVEIKRGKETDMDIYVKTANGEEYKGTGHHIVFIEKRVWAADGDMDHTLVLYQDGSARILPIVPHGLETYIPFGNDIVIGQANPLHMRPHAPIKKLVITPENYMIDVHYQDGGFATLNLFSSIKETNITVSNVSFTGDMRQKPFAIFRSTWVEDGRAKVDHITVNGLPAEHILLDGWTTRYGTNFIFFRKCISVYNTQSPDFSVEILSKSELDLPNR